MASDPGYSPKLPLPGNALDKDEQVGLSGAADVRRNKVLVTNSQLLFLGGELLLLFGVFAFFVVTKPDYISMLWTHPMGIKLLITAAVSTIINFGGFLGTCVLVNQWAPPDNEERRVARAAGHWVIGGVLAILFYLPVFFVLLIGPAVIAIQENLSGP